MEKEMIKFLCGLVLTAIVPLLLIRQLRKGAVFSGTKENQRNILYNISIISISVISAVNQNSEILMGTLIGCAIFQLLAICGVNKLNTVGNHKEGLSVNKSQYLIFCAILLLFLSADYLLRGKSVENILNQIDGGILIFLFFIYFYFAYWRRKDAERFIKTLKNVLSIRKNSLMKSRNLSKETAVSPASKKVLIEIIFYFLLAVIIIVGNCLLFEGTSKLGVELKISQYCIGLTLLTWSNNLLGILLESIEEKEDDRISEEELPEIEIDDGEALIEEAVEEEERNLENIIDGIIFSLTLVLGVIAVGKPVMIHIYMIYDLIVFGIISILFQFVSKIDSRLAGSGMATIYIGFIVYAFIR